MSDDKTPPPPSERTIIRPARAPGTPPLGGAMPVPPAFPPPPGQAPGFVPPPVAPAWTPPAATTPSPSAGGAAAKLDFADAEPELYGPEPLVAAAGRLIHLASRLRTMPTGPELGPLRQLVTNELTAFSKRAQGLGLEPKSVQLAHYILCAFMDDAVMSTPWGANSPWSQHSLLAAYHNDTQGGERLYAFAERMEQDPNREPRLAELLYQCLALGFEGRAALDPRGASMLQQRRAGLAALVQRQRGAAAPDFSPQWRGVEAKDGRYAPQVPLWVIASGLALVGLVIFAALLFRLSTESGAAVEALDQVVGSSVPKPAAPAPETSTPTFTRIRDILAPDIQAGRLDVLREGDNVVVRLVNQGLFGSGAAEPAAAWSDTFGRLAQAANLTKGPMRIEGHTDNQQIRSLAFPSNLDLSRARAEAVARAIRGAGLADANRIATAGFGDAQPIADNATPDGRRQNRRVEIRVANDVAWR